MPTGAFGLRPKGQTAWDFLMSSPHEEIVRVLSQYGETADAAAARRIADVVCLARSRNALPRRTREFAALVAQGKGPEYQAMHPAKLTFQALRIHLNNEFDEMRRGICAAFGLLGEGGRIGLISWKHSECHIIMDIFRSLEAVRDKEPLLKWYRAQPDCDVLPERWSMEMDEVTRPSERELQTNSRSRSALLHVLRKRRAPRLADLEHKAHALPTWCSVTEASEASGARRPKRKRVAEEEEAEEAEAAEVEVEVAGEANPALKWPCARCGQKTHRSSECPSQLEGCNYCGQVGHTTRRCTFGAKRSERFLFCEALRPRLGCFWRRFLVPLTRGDATTFLASAPRGGRVDVGLRCLSAGLFRSQGLRRNTQVCLSFEASGHVLEVSGALVRGLVPDEPRLAERVEAALAPERQPPDPKEDPEAWCTSPLRGMQLRARSSQAALKAMLKAKEGRIALLILDADGEPISQVLKQQ
ncbi:unnamed protein product, partial [Effrenium voratum]